MADTADTPPPQLLPQLLAENARLKTMVGIPEHERVLQHVLQEQLQRFFDDARRTLEGTMSRAVGLGDKTEEVAVGEGNEGGTQCISALVETLRVLGAQNEGMLREMNEKQTECVMELNSRVEALTRERDTLQERVLNLEEEVAAAAAPAAPATTTTTTDVEVMGTDEHQSLPPRSLLAELQYLRASDTLLRQKLSELQRVSEAATAEADKIVKDSLQSALDLPRLLRELGETRVKLHHVEGERELFRQQVEELQERVEVQHRLRETQLEEEVALGQSTVRKLLTRISSLEAGAEEAQVAAAAQNETIAQLKSTIHSLQTKETVADETLAFKRRRLEKEIFDDPDSVRRELISFWHEGGEELRQLRAENQQLREKERQLRATQEKLAQMERTRSTVTSKLVTLADEISRGRAENQSLRAQCVGIEVERDYMRRSLASAISSHMNEEELRQCCEEIRESAAKAAAASLSVVADPQAIQQAMRQSQELKNEVAQLIKQKEKLHRYITLHEERITALITRASLMKNDGTNDNDNNNIVDADGSVLQTVKKAEMLALDVLTALEEEASINTKGGIRRQEIFCSMQQRQRECEDQLEACRKQLLEVTNECDEVKKRLEEIQVESRATLAAREDAMSELMKSNEMLMKSTKTLRTENQQVRESYNVSIAFSQKLSTALSDLLELLRAETSLAASLYSMLTEEREEIVELTRRSAEAWNAREGEVQQVVEVINRMCGYIAQALEQQQRIRTLDETVHLRHLMDSLKQQEERLKETQETFTQSCQKMTESLAQRITAAQQNAEAIWKERLAKAAEERQLLKVRLGEEKDLLARIERALVVAPTSSPPPATTPTRVITTSTAPNNNNNNNNNNSATAVEPSHSYHRVLDAVNQILALSSQQAMENVGNEEGEKQREVEEDEQREDEEIGEPVHDATVPPATTTTATTAAADDVNEEEEEESAQTA